MKVHGGNRFGDGWSGDGGRMKKKPVEPESDPPLFPPLVTAIEEAESSSSQKMIDLITKHRDIKEGFRIFQLC